MRLSDMYVCMCEGVCEGGLCVWVYVLLCVFLRGGVCVKVEWMLKFITIQKYVQISVLGYSNVFRKVVSG